MVSELFEFPGGRWKGRGKEVFEETSVSGQREVGFRACCGAHGLPGRACDWGRG